MGKVVDFPNKDNQPNEEKGLEMNPEELKLLIEQNTMLQYCLKIMNDIPLSDETPVDYMELWNKVSLQKKIDPGEVTGEAIAFYFQLLSTGYDNFGAMFFYHMAQSENASILFYALKCFIEYMSDFQEEIFTEKEFDIMNKFVTKHIKEVSEEKQGIIKKFINFLCSKVKKESENEEPTSEK